MDEVDSGAEFPALRRDPRRPFRGADPLEDRLDRWVNRGKQLVDGVSGARPGTRAAGRGSERRPGARPALDSLGRWVENKIDWLLEDGDDWREPWEERQPVPMAGESVPRAGEPVEPVRPRRRLEAVSRRGQAGASRAAADAADSAADSSRDSASLSAFAGGAVVGDSNPDDWPDDAAFSLPRWQRGEEVARENGAPTDNPPPSHPPDSGGRPLPRSSRRRG